MRDLRFNEQHQLLCPRCMRPVYTAWHVTHAPSNECPPPWRAYCTRDYAAVLRSWLPAIRPNTNS